MPRLFTGLELPDLVASQLALMVAAAMPLERWRSFQTTRAPGRRQERPLVTAKLAVESGAE